MTVKAITDFDGACPHASKGVRKKRGANEFVFYPGYRAKKGVGEEAGTGARFSTRLVNDSEKAESCRIIVDWMSSTHTRHRDIGFIRHDSHDEWTMIPGKRESNLVTYDLTLPPGTTHLGLYPEYNVEQCDEFLQRIKEKGVNVTLAGKSREGREIWLARVGKLDRSLPNFLVQARDHAYETAGSYCVEGMIDFLLAGDELANYILSKFNVYVLPMTNVDGVYNGMSRLTWEDGANLNREVTKTDGAWEAIKKTIDRLKPAAYMNIHNFQNRFEDGLYVNEERIAKTFQRFMRADTEHYKSWQVQTSFDFLRAKDVLSCPDENRSWKNYVKNTFNSVAITFEFPWFMLNTAAMREKGKNCFIAMALTVVEDKKL